MTFHEGRIYVVSGFGYDRYPNYLCVLNTEGKLMAYSAESSIVSEVEGIDFDGDSITIATKCYLYR